MRPIPLAPGYPDFADQAEHQIMLPSQFADRHQGLAAAILAHVASLGRLPALLTPGIGRELAGAVGAKVTSSAGGQGHAVPGPLRTGCRWSIVRAAAGNQGAS